MQNNQIHITVDVEEWFHSNWFNTNSVIEKYYNGIEPRTDVVETTNKLIELFDENNVKATFFVLGETALKYPNLLDLINESEHELASHGFYHNKTKKHDEEFGKDVKKFKKEIKADVSGFRFPNFSYDLNKLEILIKEGFLYDSSVVPCLNIPGWYGESGAPIKPYKKELNNELSIMEFPISVMPYLRLPGSGGWFLRNVGYFWTKIILQYSIRNTNYGMLYIHPWEISDNNPTFKEIKFHTFRRTGKYTFKSIEKLIKNFSKCKYLTLSETLKNSNKRNE